MVCWLYLHDKGISLHQYCLQHKYDYQKIHNFIVYKGLSINDAIELYLSRRGRRDCKTKYFYKGVPMKKFCKEHNYHYSTILSLMKNKCMTCEQAMEWHIAYKEKKNAKRKETKD